MASILAKFIPHPGKHPMRDNHQREQARAELAPAIALYRNMDMPFWLPQAEAALAQVEWQ